MNHRRLQEDRSRLTSRASCPRTNHTDAPAVRAYDARVNVGGLSVDEKQLGTVCQRYRVARLEIFGSVGRREAGEDSDVDLLYELEPGARLGWDVEDLADELSALLGRHVDLISRNALHERLTRPGSRRGAAAVCSVMCSWCPR